MGCAGISAWLFQPPFRLFLSGEDETLTPRLTLALGFWLRRAPTSQTYSQAGLAGKIPRPLLVTAQSGDTAPSEQSFREAENGWHPSPSSLSSRAPPSLWKQEVVRPSSYSQEEEDRVCLSYQCLSGSVFGAECGLVQCLLSQKRHRRGWAAGTRIRGVSCAPEKEGFPPPRQEGTRSHPLRASGLSLTLPHRRELRQLLLHRTGRSRPQSTWS